MCSSHLFLLPFLNRFDRTLGGLEMELRLREHLAGLFNEQRKGQRVKDVRENPRAMAKLLREANRLKTVLSANADHMAQVRTCHWLRAIFLRVEPPTILSEATCAWCGPSLLPVSPAILWNSYSLGFRPSPPRKQDLGENSDIPYPLPD